MSLLDYQRLFFSHGMLKIGVRFFVQHSFRVLKQNIGRAMKAHHCGGQGLFTCLLLFVVILTVTWFQQQLEEAVYLNYLHSKNKTSHICAVMSGRLGNNMFQYAATYGVSRQRNMTMVIDEKAALHSVFDNLLAQKDGTGFCHRFSARTETLHSGFSIDIDTMSNVRNYRMGTYLQSWKYFQNVEDEIREQFTFAALIQNEARTIFDDHLRKHNVKNPLEVTFVGVHVRGGDILRNNRFVRFGYKAPDVQYYLKAFKIMRKVFSRVLFIITSNNREWVETNLSGEDVTMIEGQHPPEVDMATLTLCNHTIMSVGTFSWWTAFLTGGLTIYYKHPAREGSELQTTFSEDMLDYFYPTWIGLD